MTNEPKKLGEAAKELIPVIMRQVGSVSRHFDLETIQFTSCRYTYSSSDDPKVSEISIAFPDIRIIKHADELKVVLNFEFRAPSPFSEDVESNDGKCVHVNASLIVIYSRKQGDLELQDQDLMAFAKVNGVYNAWPYLREYVQNSLVRLGLPPYDLPLLNVSTAVLLSGMIEPGQP